MSEILSRTAPDQLDYNCTPCAVQRIRTLSMSRVAISLPIDNVSLKPMFDPQSRQVPIGHHVEEYLLILGVVWSGRKWWRVRTALKSHVATRFHVTCFARSLSSCGLQCTLCNQSLAEFSRSSSFSACSLFPRSIIDVDRPPHQSWVEFSGSSCWVSTTSRDASVLLLPSNWPATPVWTVERPPDGVVSFSCGTFFRVGSWMVVRLLLEHGGPFACSTLRFTSMSPVFECAHDGGGCCSFPSLFMVFEMSAPFGGLRCWASHSSGRISGTSSDPTWLVHPGPIKPHGTSYGWGDPLVTAPGSGTQSWLLCPLSTQQDLVNQFLQRTILVVHCSGHYWLSDHPFPNIFSPVFSCSGIAETRFVGRGRSSAIGFAGEMCPPTHTWSIKCVVDGPVWVAFRWQNQSSSRSESIRPT